ncbi:MAG: tRNA lysidine(34) synthetase TilS [Anaerolineales bacterium]|nr:tRNA lysidine(34) synthetase TilS [Anaerolineales bacterium]
MVVQQLIETCRQYQLIEPNTPLVVAVSGGIDSLVMLHALKQLEIPLHVVTLDHGIRGEDGVADALFVENLAQSWGLPCVRGAVDVPTLAADYGLNIEATARQARYTFLLEVALRIGSQRIAIAHNHDDQAETVLMHIIRGAGLRGLQGMLYQTFLSEDHLLLDWPDMLGEDVDPSDYSLIRPLLDVPRSAIEAYAAEHGLSPRQDATNADVRYLRNQIRHQLLPMLKTMNPNIHDTLNRLATVVQGEVAVVDSRVEQVAAWMLEWSETEPDDEGEIGEVVFLDRQAFMEQPLGIQRGLLRKAMFELAPAARDLSFDLVERARLLILQGQTGSQIELPDAVYLRVGYDEVTIGYGGNPVYPYHLPCLRAGQLLRIDPHQEGQVIKAGNLALVSYWVVEGRSRDLRPATPLECTLAIPEGAMIGLRTWQDGDRFKPFGMRGKSQKLSDTFINLKIPAFYRDQVPLLTINDEIAWFVAPTANGPQARIADTFAVRDDTAAILRFRWQEPR